MQSLTEQCFLIIFLFAPKHVIFAWKSLLISSRLLNAYWLIKCKQTVKQSKSELSQGGWLPPLLYHPHTTITFVFMGFPYLHYHLGHKDSFNWISVGLSCNSRYRTDVPGQLPPLSHYRLRFHFVGLVHRIRYVSLKVFFIIS